MRHDLSKYNVERTAILPDPDIAAAYENGATASELAAQYGVSRPTIFKSLRRSGVTSRKAARRPGKGVGPENSAWNGGRRPRLDGYWLVWTPEGERLEHRVVMERHLNRRLTDSEIVHHRDGDRSHNDPANLEIMTQSDHARLHSPEMHAARYGHDR